MSNVNDVSALTNLVVAAISLVLVVLTAVLAIRETRRIKALEAKISKLEFVAKRTAHNSAELRKQIDNILGQVAWILGMIEGIDFGVEEGAKERLNGRLSKLMSACEKISLEWKLSHELQQTRTEAQKELAHGQGDLESLEIMTAISRGEYGFTDQTIAEYRHKLYVRLGYQFGFTSP